MTIIDTIDLLQMGMAGVILLLIVWLFVSGKIISVKTLEEVVRIIMKKKD